MIKCKTCMAVSVDGAGDIDVSMACAACGDNNFEVDIETYLCGSGPFSVVPGMRDAQVRAMREIVDHNNTQPLLLEAEVGTGKTMAYLVAGVFGRQSVLVATSSKNLQNQIAEKEMPKIAAAYKLTTGKDLFWTVIKGKKNYICKRMVPQKVKSQAREAKKALDTWLAAEDVRLQNGEKLTHLFESMPEIARREFQRTTSVDVCTASCQFANSCGYRKAKDAEANGATVVITNHHLLIAWYRAARFQEATLPPQLRHLVVIDEAHEFAEAARDGLGISVSMRTIRNTVTLMIMAVQTMIDEYGTSTPSVFNPTQFDAAVDELLTFARLVRREAVMVDKLTDRDSFVSAITKIAGGMQACLSSAKIVGRVNGLTDAAAVAYISRFCAADEEDVDAAAQDEEGAEDDVLDRTLRNTINDMERLASTLALGDALTSGYIVSMVADKEDTIITCSPTNLSIGGFKMESQSVHLPNAPSPTGEYPSMFVLTSGTLLGCGSDRTVHLRYDYTNMLFNQGEEPKIVEIKSPFDYKNQMACYYPKDGNMHPSVARSNPEKYYSTVVEHTEDVLKITDGFALILVTSYSAMNEIKSRIKWNGVIVAQNDYESAGAATDEYVKLAKSARRDKSAGPVLIGVQSFWRGVSIEGNLLVNVVIPKMDFQVPTDPIVEVRGKLDSNYFQNGSVQYAYTQMTQGVGRLIRTKSDYGIVSIFDARLKGSKWGETIWRRLAVSKRYTSDLDLIEKTYNEMRRFYDPDNA